MAEEDDEGMKEESEVIGGSEVMEESEGDIAKASQTLGDE